MGLGKPTPAHANYIRKNARDAEKIVRHLSAINNQQVFGFGPRLKPC